MTGTHEPTVFHDAARLRAVLDSAVDGVVTIDERGVIEAANPAAERLFGYSASELVGHNVSMLMPAPYDREHTDYIARYLRTGEKNIIGRGREVLGRRKDGTIFPLYLAVSETDFGDRRVFTGSLHDLTALKQAEQQVVQFGRILEDSLNEIFIFDAETLNFVRVNQGALRNIGYTTEEISQLQAPDIRPDIDEQQYREMLRPLISEREHVLQFETRYQRKDRSLYNVVVRLHMTEWQGRSAFVAIVLDVTDRVQRDTELRIRNRAIQAANEGVMIADAAHPDHPIIFVNPAFEQLSGYSAQDAVGQPCSLLCLDDPEQEELRQLREAIQLHREFRTTLECVRRCGERFWNNISVAPVRSSAGEVTHIVAVMEDVSEHRHAQEKLLQSERLAAIGQMVTGLAHESRNALQRAQACLDMLALDLEDQPEQLELTEKTRRALQDLHRYYEEVRNYAAPIVLERSAIDLRRLWNATWRDLESERFGRDIQLIDETPDLDVTCDVDDHRMAQVFRNILDNSVVACSDPALLTITASETTWEHQRCVRICFCDNGPGFSPEAVGSVFQPFFTTRQKGTGLGMAIVRRIVDAHGGHIEASQAANGGAEVILILPRGRTQRMTD